MMFTFSYSLSDDESELSDNEKEVSLKGDSLLNGTSNGLTLNGCLSHDGELLFCFRPCDVKLKVVKFSKTGRLHYRFQKEFDLTSCC